MNDSHTTSFIVDSPDYFAAHTDNNEIRLAELKNRMNKIDTNIQATELLIEQSTDDDSRERHVITKRALVIKEYELELIFKLQKSPQHKI